MSDNSEERKPYVLTEDDYQFVRNVIFGKFINTPPRPPLTIEDLVDAGYGAIESGVITYNKNVHDDIPFRGYIYKGILLQAYNLIKKTYIKEKTEVSIEILTNRSNQEDGTYSLIDFKVSDDYKLHKNDLLDYTYLTQEELELWEEYCNSNLPIIQFAKEKGNKSYDTTRTKLLIIQDKLIYPILEHQEKLKKLNKT